MANNTRGAQAAIGTSGRDPEAVPASVWNAIVMTPKQAAMESRLPSTALSGSNTDRTTTSSTNVASRTTPITTQNLSLKNGGEVGDSCSGTGDVQYDATAGQQLHQRQRSSVDTGHRVADRRQCHRPEPCQPRRRPPAPSQRPRRLPRSVTVPR